jgi:hypothetical protein
MRQDGFTAKLEMLNGEENEEAAFDLASSVFCKIETRRNRAREGLRRERIGASSLAS